MTTPEPLTYREIDQMAADIHLFFHNNRVPIDRLIYTARLGAKFIEMTHAPKEND